MSKVKPVPEGMHTLTPHLVVKNAAKAIDYYKSAFGAKEMNRFAGPGGSIMHASIKIGDSHPFLNDEFPEIGKEIMDKGELSDELQKKLGKIIEDFKSHWAAKSVR